MSDELVPGTKSSRSNSVTAWVHDQNMGRAHRVDIEHGIHHVMNRGVNRGAVFFADADRVEFGRLLREVFERFGVEVFAYCLMTNHYHLVLYCPDGGLSDAMHLLGSVYTRHTNERIGRDGPLFRGRFHAVPIVNDEQLLCTVRYVHRNALDLPEINSVDSYRWSSHRTYLGHRARPPFLTTDPVLHHFENRGAFDAFVNSSATAGPTAWTDDVPIERIALLVQVIADELGEVHGSRAHRSLLLLVAEELPQRSGQALREQLAFATPKSLSQARTRAKQQLAAQPVLRQIIERTLDLVA